MKPIGVDCIFDPEGTVQVQRVLVGGQWQRVGSGRQWVDGHGRHLLVMFPDNQPQELLLRADTLTWALKPVSQQPQWV